MMCLRAASSRDRAYSSELPASLIDRFASFRVRSSKAFHHQSKQIKRFERITIDLNGRDRQSITGVKEVIARPHAGQSLVYTQLTGYTHTFSHAHACAHKQKKVGSHPRAPIFTSDSVPLLFENLLVCELKCESSIIVK